MISFRIIEGRTCPFFICATCNEPIRDGGMGMIAWDMRTELNPELFAVHKGRCLDRLEAPLKKAGVWLGTNEIDTFVANLMSNTGYDMGPAANYDAIGTQYEDETGRPRMPFKLKPQPDP